MDETALASFFAQQRLALIEGYLKAGRAFEGLNAEELQVAWRESFIALADDPSYRPTLSRIAGLESEFGLRHTAPDFTGLDDTMAQLRERMAEQYRKEAEADPEMFAEFTASLQAEIEAAALPVPVEKQN
ncbi:hypothetical protein [Elstera sp.]|jgi:hypothetical protein|uniref:hypothetical protein n=1 Tax=Elstera sp. TaxID=1916664 RepID=UPI0037BE99E1